MISFMTGIITCFLQYPSDTISYVSTVFIDNYISHSESIDATEWKLFVPMVSKTTVTCSIISIMHWDSGKKKGIENNYAAYPTEVLSNITNEPTDE